MTDFPLTFAVLRRSRGAYWQLFESRKIGNHYELSVAPLNRIETCILSDETSYPKVIRCKISNGSIRQFIYWYLPIYLLCEDQTIPVIDFHYKAWLPRLTYRVPQDPSSEVIQIHNTFEERWANHFTSYLPDEDEHVNRFTERPMRPPTPPRSRTYSLSDEDSVSIRTLSPPGGEPSLLDFPTDIPVSPSVSVSVSVSRPLPIPDIVGSLLIRNAREGNDSCPITATPYSEIDSLSATSCFHIFETASIRRWLIDQNTCPVCRTSILNMITKEN